MSEKIIIVDSLDPVRFFGVNNEHLKTIKTYFPKLQIVSRGSEVKVIGTDEVIDDFQGKFLLDRKSTRLNSSHIQKSRMPSSA